MKKISTTIFTTLIFFSLSGIAQAPLKISTKPSSEKVLICNTNGQKFPIKNADDQAACDQLKKPNKRIHDTTFPSQPIGTPISTPPTGN